jgi:hypothetical protein
LTTDLTTDLTIIDMVSHVKVITDLAITDMVSTGMVIADMVRPGIDITEMGIAAKHAPDSVLTDRVITGITDAAMRPSQASLVITDPDGPQDRTRCTIWASYTSRPSTTPASHH